MNLTQEQQTEIARLIADGFTSGRLDGEDGSRLSWELKTEDASRCAHMGCASEAMDGSDSCAGHQWCKCPPVNGKYHAHYMHTCPNNK